MKAFFVKISGRVTGVGFRFATFDKACEFRSISGYVRNITHGEVEVFLQGEEKDLNNMLEWLNHGPPFARVDSVTLTEKQYNPDIKGFSIK